MAKFPQGFIWGAAASAYQIEGAVNADGRGESIWDRFCHTPGKIANGEINDIACDHYHRYAEDVQLMQTLGVNAYRFSIAWPRILPQGKGKPNEAGLAFYDRLVDSLLAANITPYAFLYHWDLPQALEDEGGWLNRATTDAFAGYTDVISSRLGDRVKNWGTINEPLCIALLGYFLGMHAPGHHDPTLLEMNTALHHVFVAHGKAVSILRANIPGCKVGVALNIYPIYPASDSPEDGTAAQRYHGFHNDWFSVPILKGEYPPELLAGFGSALPPVQDGDMQLISPDLDYIGLNYYSRLVIAHDEHSSNPMKIREVHMDGNPHTVMNWEIYPDGLYDVLHKVNQQFHPKEILIAENGCAMPDELAADGKVHDPGRIEFLRGHLQSLQRAIRDGIPVKGYFVWSLLDNFEWSNGFSMRFGIVYVDYPTLRRFPKDSYTFYQNVIRNNGLLDG